MSCQCMLRVPVFIFIQISEYYWEDHPIESPIPRPPRERLSPLSAGAVRGLEARLQLSRLEEESPGQINAESRPRSKSAVVER